MFMRQALSIDRKSWKREFLLKFPRDRRRWIEWISPQVMNVLKGKNAEYLHKKFPELREQYWGMHIL